MTDESTPAPRRGPSRLALVLIGVGAGVLALLVIGAIALGSVVAEVLTFGPTAVGNLRPGACLIEPAVDAATYTVTDCAEEPTQQVVAAIDLSRNTAQYSTASSLSAYANAICDRYLEYGLFVQPDVTDRDFDMVAIGVPTPEQVADGQSTALCALVRLGGGPLLGDHYRPMP